MITVSKFKKLLQSAIPHSDYEVAKLTRKDDGKQGYRVRLFRESPVMVDVISDSHVVLHSSVLHTSPFYLKELTFVDEFDRG